MKKITIFCLAFLFAADLSAAMKFAGKTAPRCGFKVVSYRFVGPAGTQVTYAKRSFTIPQSGMAERIAVKEASTFDVAGRTIELPQTSPVDEFGTATVHLISSSSSGSTESTG